MLDEPREVLVTNFAWLWKYEMPSLGISGSGVNQRDAYGRFLWEFERALRERKEFSGEVWENLRKINRVNI